MKKVITLSMMLVMLSLLLGGCASKQQVESIEARSRRTSEEQRRLIMQLERELAEARQQLSQEIERTNTPVAQKTADIWVELNSLRQQFALLTGQVEVMQVRMDNQLGSANATMPTLRERLSAVEFAMENDLNVELETVAAMEAARSASPQSEKQGVAAAESNGTAAEPVAAPEPEKKPADPAKALYDRAMGEYKQGNYEKARTYWAEFSETFKEHPYRASSIFWQGQSYYKLKDYGRAALLYDDVIKKYPKSSKVPAAMLKQGYALMNLGKQKAGKAALNLLVKRFPDSREAKQALQYLEKK